MIHTGQTKCLRIPMFDQVCFLEFAHFHFRGISRAEKIFYLSAAKMTCANTNGD